MKSYLSPSSLLALLLLLLTGCQTVAPAKRRDISQLPEAKRVCQLLQGNRASWKTLWIQKGGDSSLDENTYSYDAVAIDRSGNLSYTESQRRKWTQLNRNERPANSHDVNYFLIKPTKIDLASAAMRCDESDHYAMEDAKIIGGHDIQLYYPTKGRKRDGVLVRSSGLKIKNYKSDNFIIKFPSREKAAEFQNAFKCLATAINSPSH